MRSTLLAGSVLLALTTLGCASASPDEVCRQMVDQLCERNFECRTDKDTAVFQYAYGASAEECKSRFYVSNGCAERTEDAQNCVGYNAGKEDFDAGRFEECQEALGKLACQDYVNQQNDPKLAPAACRQMCG
ncbi:hypothetical protein JRI60_15640 [Archangium violaceum]|uniref:hypothetical protein n=1 Tax=Archangium violaceum TaxID=83451 RepID=UPI001951640B|nr:hypothetical protein [Archangium violaceum]QRO00354.1 hypothetical protein JRI60_15640 [Archangium violaceum]